MALATLLPGSLTVALATVWWRYGENHTVSIAIVLSAVLTVTVPTVSWVFDRRAGSDAAGSPINVEPAPAAKVSGATTQAPLGRLPREVPGRHPLVRDLEHQLSQGGLVVLTGAGGVGKSTVAGELVRRMRSRHGRKHPRVWWVSGTTLSSLSAGLVTVARDLGATEGDLEAIASQATDGPDRLWRLLEQAPKGWLLIIDNADDPRLLAEPALAGTQSEPVITPQVADGTGWVRARPGGLVLLSSRQSDQAFWGAQATLKRVGMLPDSQAAEVLLDLAPNAGDRIEAEALGHRLGGLPLALHLAGSYLGSEFASHSRFEAYRQALDSDPYRASLFEPDPDSPQATEERAAVMRTWELSLDALAERGLPQARPLLRLLSCYAPDSPIPIALLRPRILDQLLGVPDTDDTNAAGLRLERSLRGLSRLGLIEPGPAGQDEPAVAVHPVVADTNLAYLLRPEPSDPSPLLIRQTAVTLLETVLDVLIVDRSLVDWMVDRRPDQHIFRLLTEHLMNVMLSSWSDLLDDEHFDSLVRVAIRAAGACERMDWISYGLLLEFAAMTMVSRRDGDQIANLDFHRDLAWDAEVHGHRAASFLFRALLKEWRRVLGDDHRDTLDTRHQRALAAVREGSWTKAKATFREILAGQRRVLGEDHLSTLTTHMSWP